MRFCRPRATTVLFCAVLLSAVLLPGCLALEERQPAAPVVTSAPVEVWPGFAIEAWRYPDAGISDFASDRLVQLITERLRRNQPTPGAPDRLVRLVFSDYQAFVTALDYDDNYGSRLRIAGTLELIDPGDGTVIASERLVRSLRLRGFREPWPFRLRHRGRHAPWPGLASTLSTTPSQMRILTRAFASAAASWILATGNDVATYPVSTP